MASGVTHRTTHDNKEHRDMCPSSNTITIQVDTRAHLVTTTTGKEARAVK